jgi:hypothetical protein
MRWRAEELDVGPFDPRVRRKEGRGSTFLDTDVAMLFVASKSTMALSASFDDRLDISGLGPFSGTRPSRQEA